MLCKGCARLALGSAVEAVPPCCPAALPRLVLQAPPANPLHGQRTHWYMTSIISLASRSNESSNTPILALTARSRGSGYFTIWSGLVHSSLVTGDDMRGNNRHAKLKDISWVQYAHWTGDKRVQDAKVWLLVLNGRGGGSRAMWEAARRGALVARADRSPLARVGTNAKQWYRS